MYPGSSMKDPKRLSLRDNHISYNFTKCYMRINKQLVNLVYNDMKNLMYSLICFNGVQSVF